MIRKDVEIGIIGGTGLCDPAIFKSVREVKVCTPYGKPSDLVTIGYVKDQKVAFIPRHGKRHQIPPHKINFRANIWALKELGVHRIISPSAVGSLKDTYNPGEFVIIDQFIDRTKNRGDTFYEGGQVCHISSADPFCSELRSLFINSAKKLNLPCHSVGTYVCIQGPRFSTRAESKLFRSWGAEVIGMTLYPECILAREKEICFVSVAMITDYDVWKEIPVSINDVLSTMSKNSKNFKELILNTVSKISKERICTCGEALKSALI